MSVSDRVVAIEKRKRHDAACKEVIENLPTVALVGARLLEIQELEVWRETHKTFELFVKDKFNLERRRAYQLIEAATTRANLCTNGTQTLIPSNERQLREVGKAPPELQAEVVRIAVERAAEENRAPTASDYKKVVGELLSEQEQEQLELESTPMSGTSMANPIDLSSVEPDEPEDDYPDPKQLAGPLMAHVKTLTQMLNSLKKLSVEHGGQWIDVQSISTQITDLKHNIKSSIYYADCPACSGKGCDRCRQSGFLPELKKDSV